MQFTLAAIALGAAVIGLVCTNLFTRAPDEPRSVGEARLFWSLFTWVGLLGVVLFLATLPTRPPFAPGLSLGWGFLIGLVALAVVAASFKVLHGFGESLALVGGIALNKEHYHSGSS